MSFTTREELLQRYRELASTTKQYESREDLAIAFAVSERTLIGEHLRHLVRTTGSQGLFEGVIRMIGELLGDPPESMKTKLTTSKETRG